MLSEMIEKVFVVSLLQDTERRAYIKEHFAERGIVDYEFSEAVQANSAEVAKLYLDGRVVSYPSCFRCGKDNCQCQNNILIPQQVANWLAFHKVWKRATTCSGWILICEDDVYFYQHGIKLLNHFIESISLTEQPQLVRLSESGRDPSEHLDDVDALTTSDRVVMSNPAYLINNAMAKYLLQRFDRIATTSDIWLHKIIAEEKNVSALTVQPLLATELSFNKAFAKFRSAIHPKGIDVVDEQRARSHKKRVESAVEYYDLRESWLQNAVSENVIAPVAENYFQHYFDVYFKHSETRKKWQSVDGEGNPIPWITYAALFQLEQYDFSECSVFEWGSGYSTGYWMTRSKSVITVDHDPDWSSFANSFKNSNTTCILSGLANYADKITLNNNENRLFNVIVIDGYIHGSLRYHCAKKAVKYIAEGGIIILDNSDWLSETCAYLRSQGFTQTDYMGFGPSNNYPWVTSIFFKGNIAIPRKEKASPGFIVGGIRNIRD